MGDILPFVARVRASSDWSVAERARLEELAERFGALAEGIEVVFGATDEGDPWCVVKDAYDDVLVHVARIGGRFVIHYAMDDALKEGADLQTVLGERLNWAEDEREDVVVPFSRQAQSFIALLIATAFYLETQHLETGLDPAAQDAGDGEGHAQLAQQAAGLDHLDTYVPHAKAAGLALVLDTLVEPARSFAATADPAPELDYSGRVALAGGESAYHPTAEAAIALAQPARWAGDVRPMALQTFEATPARIVAVSGDMRAESYPGAQTTGADKTFDGFGPPTTESFFAGGGGARQGLVEGTDANEQITMGPNVVARGGGGADTFVVESPNVMGDPESRLGVVADFKAGEGDRLLNVFGKAVAVTLVTATVVTLPAAGGLTPTDGSGTVTVLGHRLDLDLNGDGHADGHLVLVDEVPPPKPTLDLAPVVATYEPDAAPIVLVGHSLDAYGA